MKSYIFSSNLIILNSFKLKHKKYKYKYMKIYLSFRPSARHDPLNGD
jgi:hypothetical protein